MNMSKLIFLLLAIILLTSGCVYSNNTTEVWNGTTATVQSQAVRSYFLHDDVFTGLPYASLQTRQTFDPGEPVETVTHVSLPNGNTSISNWTSPELNTTLLPASTHTLHLHALRTGGGARVIKIFYQCGIVNSTGGDLIIEGTSDFSPEITTTLPYTEFNLDMLMPDQNVNSTDRMVIFVYANQTGTGALPTLQLQFDDMTDSRLEFRAVSVLNFENGILKSLS